MPNKTRKNRANELQRVKSELSNKQQFKLVIPKTVIPGQMIQLFATALKNDFQGIQLKESNPKEYLKQKLKIQRQNLLNLKKLRKRIQVGAITVFVYQLLIFVFFSL